MSDWVIAVVGVVASSSLLDTLLRIISGRKTTRIDNAVTLANQAMQQAVEARQEAAAAHGAVNKLRTQLYPHQRWDQLAHREALKSDPEFPPPPEISI